MFSSLRRTPLAQLTLGALDLARSFLMLEDDEGVDWEVDRNEPDTPIHPHRVPLRSAWRPRRPGMLPGARQDCTCPTSYGVAVAGASGARGGAAAPAADRRPGRTETRPGRLSAMQCPRG